MTNHLESYFNLSPNFEVITNNFQSDEIQQNEIGYLNPVCPKKIQIIDKREMAYLEKLTTESIQTLADHLVTADCKVLIFSNITNIHNIFLNMDTISIIRSTSNVNIKTIIESDLNKHTNKEASIHGAFAIVYNQGILITGEPGAGKSSLLMELVKKGHLWVADDALFFNLSKDNIAYCNANDVMPHHIHIRNLGLIDMNSMYGKCKQVFSHSLAANIHLSNDKHKTSGEDLAFDSIKNLTLLSQKFPKWIFYKNTKNLSSIVEICAQHLIAKQWDLNFC